MTPDDDDRRATLAKRGIAIAGVARAGLARSGLTPDARWDYLEAAVAELRARVAHLEARMQALFPARRAAGHNTSRAARKQRTTFVRLVDAELAKPDEPPLHEAVRRVLRKKDSKRWATLAPPERKAAVVNGLKRYHRGKQAP